MTDDQLTELEDMAKIMLSKKEIAVILDIDPDEFIDQLEDKMSPEWKRFQSGRMKSVAQIRKAIFDLAAAGSSPAQAEAMKLIENAKIDDQ